MSKLFISLVLSLVFITGIGIAQLQSSNDFTSDLTKDENDALERKGITSPTVSDIICEEGICSSIVYQRDGINKVISFPEKHCTQLGQEPSADDGFEGRETPCLTFSDFTESELVEMRDAKIDQLLKDVAQTQIMREDRSKNIKANGGDITIG